MTPVERLQAARHKLETLKAEPRKEITFKSIEHGGAVHLLLARAQSRVDLFDRTIDAQLAILRDGIRRVHEWTDPNGELGYDPELDGDGSRAVPLHLALADAILGGDL